VAIASGSGPADEAVRQLARIALGADAPEQFDVMPESAGLRSMIAGLVASGFDEAEIVSRSAVVYDALLASLRQRVEAGDPLETGPMLDPVSGLPNRLLFLDRLAQAIAYAHRHDMLLAVCSIRVELGEAAPFANRVVAEIGARLKDTIRELDTIARLGFEEFGVVLNDLRNRENAMVAVAKMEAVFEQPFEAGPRSQVLRPRIGLCYYPAHGHDAQMLLESARLALARQEPLAIFGEA
jgi:diguanylate cyclase (GGDEF)-like protein